MRMNLKVLNNSKGFTLLELLTVIAVISILTLIALPQFNAYKARSYDADAKANLHNVFLACKAYWVDTVSSNPCTLTLATNNSYGFNQSEKVSINFAGAGTEMAFLATGMHSQSSNIFTIDASGNINP